MKIELTDQSDLERLRAHLKQKRVDMGISQRALATLMGRSQSCVSQLESGANEYVDGMGRRPFRQCHIPGDE